MMPVVSGRQVGTVVALYLAVLVARYLWACRKLNNKLHKKWKSSQKTFKHVENELQKQKLPVEERDAILSLSLAKLQAKLQSGELKAVDVLKAYQDKALEVNASINCATECITEAHELAARCDETGDRSRLLHGIPISLKDNVGVKGYDRTGGMQINIDKPCKEDSVMVQVLKRHGAIPFMRTNIPQALLSHGCSNSIYGTTLNPLDTTRTPGGSSGGEGALIGAGGSLLGLGSDVGGSLRVPAVFCGICAFKPTVGRFSKVGMYSVTRGQTLISGSFGPLARDVHGLVVMTRVLASPDMFELDPSLPPLPFQEHVLNSTRKLKIGYYTWDGNFACLPVVCRAVQEAKAALESLGHTLVDFTPPNHSEMYGKLFAGTMVGQDGAETVRTALKDDYVDLGLKIFKLYSLPSWLIALVSKLISIKEPIVGRAVKNARSDRRTVSHYRHVNELLDYRESFINVWKSQGLDAVICPVFPSPAPKVEHIGYLTAPGSGCTLYNTLNFPAGAVPVTKVTSQDVADVNNPSLYRARTRIENFLKKSCDSEESVGLPVGVQCATLPYTEELCLRVMKELETAVNYKAL